MKFKTGIFLFPLLPIHSFIFVHNPQVFISDLNERYKYLAVRRKSRLLSRSNNQGFQQYGQIDSSLCRLTYDEIVQLIRDRNKARRSRNFQKADDILAKLRDENVFLHDKKKLWRADGEVFERRGQSSTEYTKSSFSIPISESEEEYIRKRLKERSKAKFRRDFDLADEILDELKFLKNVMVDDNNLTFQVSDKMIKNDGYVYGGKRLINIANDVLQEIYDLVRERANAKKAKEYDKADDILRELEVKHGVRVDDIKKAWFFLPRFENERSALKKKRLTKRESSKNAAKRTIVSDISFGESIKLRGNNEFSSERSNTNLPVIPDDITEIDDDDDDNDMDESVPHRDEMNQSESKLEMTERLSKCTVPVLKDKLREVGLPVSGRKAELIERLIEQKI